ncbi:MAG: molybdopterin-dependent oxidoreductase [Actinomycetota bacterium]
MGVVRGACHHDCPDTCVWEVTVEDGEAISLRGVDDHPTTQGQLCPKVNRFLDRVYHPERVLQPLRRTGPKGSGTFAPVSWEEAIGEIGERFRQTIGEHGPAAILPYSFDGTQGVIQKGILARRFFAALGASDIKRHLCGVSAWLGAAQVLGSPKGIDPEDLRLARTIVLWGTNTLVTNRHLWATIEAARADGAVVVVIDPVRTTTAERADRFLQPRPGTDVALVLGLVHVLQRDGLLDDEWLATRTTGSDDLLTSSRPWTPGRTEAETGVAAADIEWLAHTFATRRPAAIRTLVGPEHRENGIEIMRAITMLPSLTGAWRDAGGGLARSTQVWWEEAFGFDDDDLAPPPRSFNMARLGEVLTDPTLDPPVTALFVHNSNPAVIAPDQNRIIEGLARPDLFTVVAEQFLTDTARYADLVLPATTQIEQLDLAPAWGHLNIALNQPAIAPRGDARSNNDIFRALAREMALDDPALHVTDEALIRDLLDRPHPLLDSVTWETLVADGWTRFALDAGHRPHDETVFRLGALDVERAHPTGSFQLISLKQHVKFLNANYAQFPAHLPRPPEPHLEVHPDDADRLGLADGSPVVVHNERGRLTLPLARSDRLQPGLVAVPFGWWHRGTPEGRAVNALTNASVPADDRGSAAFHDTWVELTAAQTGGSATSSPS